MRKIFLLGLIIITGLVLLTLSSVYSQTNLLTPQKGQTTVSATVLGPLEPTFSEKFDLTV